MNDLVAKLLQCQPHYIRCIKSNDRKAAFGYDAERVSHQVAYLNLIETVRVRRAGFCNRQPYDRFLPRYKMLCDQTWPKWSGPMQQGCELVTFSNNKRIICDRLWNRWIFLHLSTVWEKPRSSSRVRIPWPNLKRSNSRLTHTLRYCLIGPQREDDHGGGCDPVPMASIAHRKQGPLVWKSFSKFRRWRSCSRGRSPSYSKALPALNRTISLQCTHQEARSGKLNRDKRKKRREKREEKKRSEQWWKREGRRRGERNILARCWPHTKRLLSYCSNKMAIAT